MEQKQIGPTVLPPHSQLDMWVRRLNFALIAGAACIAMSWGLYRSIGPSAPVHAPARDPGYAVVEPTPPSAPASLESSPAAHPASLAIAAAPPDHTASPSEPPPVPAALLASAPVNQPDLPAGSPTESTPSKASKPAAAKDKKPVTETKSEKRPAVKPEDKPGRTAGHASTTAPGPKEPSTKATPEARTEVPPTSAKPAAESVRPVMRASYEQAGVSSIDPTGVQFRSGRRVDIGGAFPSGEKLLGVNVANRLITTDRRVIVLEPTP